MCGAVTLYATIDGSDPSPDHYNFKGETPLGFRISSSLCVKAVAITPKGHASMSVVESYTRLETSGVLRGVAVCCSVFQCIAVSCSVLQCLVVCCSVLQCVAVCCSVLQCVAVCVC